MLLLECNNLNVSIEYFYAPPATKFKPSHHRIGLVRPRSLCLLFTFDYFHLIYIVSVWIQIYKYFPELPLIERFYGYRRTVESQNKVVSRRKTKFYNMRCTIFRLKENMVWWTFKITKFVFSLIWSFWSKVNF